MGLATNQEEYGSMYDMYKIILEWLWEESSLFLGDSSFTLATAIMKVITQSSVSGPG